MNPCAAHTLLAPQPTREREKYGVHGSHLYRGVRQGETLSLSLLVPHSPSRPSLLVPHFSPITSRLSLLAHHFSSLTSRLSLLVPHSLSSLTSRPLLLFPRFSCLSLPRPSLFSCLSCVLVSTSPLLCLPFPNICRYSWAVLRHQASTFKLAEKYRRYIGGDQEGREGKERRGEGEGGFIQKDWKDYVLQKNSYRLSGT